MFQASFLDSSGVVAITSDGSKLTIIDYSTYKYYSDTATAGGATEITLASDASSTTDFYKDRQIEILSGTGVGEKNTITAYNGTSKVATVSAWGVQPDNTSVYEIAEAGHLQSNFSEFKKINIDLPDGESYLFSTIGDGDEDITVPSLETLPITTEHIYDTGDGVFTVTLYTVPSYDDTAFYKLLDVPYVYSGSKFYKAIDDSDNKDPATETAYWEEVTIDELPIKYRVPQKASVTCNIQSCYISTVYTANNKIYSCCNTNKLCTYSDWVDAVTLLMILESISGLVDEQAWNRVSILINKAKDICNCNE